MRSLCKVAACSLFVGAMLLGTSGNAETTGNMATQNITMGPDGGGIKSLRINSATAGQYMALSGDGYMTAKGGTWGVLWSEISHLWLVAGGPGGTGKSMFMDCGGLFNFRDRDGGSASRATIDSANGNLWLGGGLSLGGNVIRNSGGTAVFAFDATTAKAAAMHDFNVKQILSLDVVSSDPASEDGKAFLYAKNDGSTAAVYVADESGTGHRIASHCDPRQYVPKAVTSFADPSVQLPYSIQHYNTILGKGQVIDVAKMVAYVEKKMQAELGDEVGRLVFNYDLPASDRVSVNGWSQQISDSQARKLLQELDTMPMVKVELSSDGQIPEDAVEEVDETKDEPCEVEITKKSVDFKTMKIVEVKEKVPQMKAVPTGRKLKRLKTGWELREDGLYRRPTTADIDLKKIVESKPQLPQWILERLSVSVSSNTSVPDLVEQLKASLAKAQVADQQTSMLSKN